MTCRNCKDTGLITVEPPIVSRPVSLPCWVCGGTVFAGMSKVQVKWYLAQYKILNRLKHQLGNVLKISTVPAKFNMAEYEKVKAAINTACIRLKIAHSPKRNHIESLTPAMSLKLDLLEYERRLLQIPYKVAAQKLPDPVKQVTNMLMTGSLIGVQV